MVEVTKSIGELFQELSDEIKRLVSEELELARTELLEKISKAGRDAIMIAAGGAVLMAGALVMLAFLVAVISLALPVWLSALIVGVVMTVTGALLVMKSVSDLKRGALKPGRTIDSLKEIREEGQWLKKRL